VAAGAVVAEVVAVAVPVPVFEPYVVVSVLAVEIHFQLLEMDALRFRGVVFGLLDLVDHPGIEHVTLLRAGETENARAAC
jgi:hypothetical protein